jgi:hypothetical protein
MAKIVADPNTLPDNTLSIPGAKPPVLYLPYQDTGHPEEVDAFRDLIRKLRGEPADRPK